MRYLLHDGYVYSISDERHFAELYRLRCGSRVANFSVSDTRPLLEAMSNFLQSASTSKEAWIVEAEQDDGFSFGFDKSPEWVMNRKPTMFVECDPYPQEFRLVARSLSGASRIRVIPGSSYELRVYAACHRCEANLQWACFNRQGTLISEHNLRLPSAKGGRSSRDYKELTLDILLPEDAYEAEVWLSYSGAKAPIDKFNSFIFLSDLSLKLKSIMSPKDFASIMLDPTQESVGEVWVFSAPVDVDYLYRHPSDIEIVSANSTDVVLPQAPSLTDPNRRATIEHFGATKVRITGIVETNYSLFLDGKRLTQSDLFLSSNNADEFDLNSRFCDGEYHTLELRDPTGCYRYCQSYILLPFQQTPWSALQEHSGSPPEFLSPAAGQRYKSLCAHIKRHSIGQMSAAQLQQVDNAHSVVLKGFVHNRDFKALVLPYHATPKVSIIIPVFNKFEVTYFCLCALIFAFVEASFEVIIVDDGSRDSTEDLKKLVQNLIYLKNEVSSGFVRACNKGANAARGDYIVLLNNDTEPSFRWLDELLDSFIIFENVGLAGSKLVYPDGRLQEAGGIVWRNGNPWNYGRLANPFDPRFSYSREVDYASAAAVMLPAYVWKQVGGFSEEFAPAYFEDTDLAFKIRAIGLRTILAAPSIVYHFEGVTSGTDVSTGVKRNQEINRPRFKRKWRDSFRSHGEEGGEPDLEKDRGIVGRVLFLDYATPREDMDAGSYAAVQEMQLFQSLGYKVSFFPQNAAYLGDYTISLQRRGIEVLHAPFYESCDEVLKRHGSELDAVYITRYYVASEAIPLVRRYAPQAKILFCNADLHFLRLLRSAAALNDELKLAEAVRVRDEELEVMRRVDVVLSYNEVEHAVILSHNLSSSRIMKLPWIEQMHDVVGSFDERSGISFLGSFNHHPNVEAVEYFASSIMPAVSKQIPDIVLHVFGSNMPDRLRNLAGPSVVMHGFASDLDDVFGKRKVFVAPLLSGAGIKGKVLAALARGIPCVLTPTAAEGIGLRHGYDCMIAETADQWASSIEALVSSVELWRSVGGNGQALVREMFSKSRGIRLMRGILEALDLPVL